MDFRVFARYGMAGARVPLSNLEGVCDYHIDSVGEFAGSYDILEMGAHFRAYMEVPRRLAIPEVRDLPHPGFFQQLRFKNRASTVTGNLGESLAGIMACTHLQCTAQDIAHLTTLRPFRRRKTPDYLLRIRGKLPPELMDHIPPATPSLPEWLAMESKASADGSTARVGVENAFQQLAAYWYTIHAVAPNEVGFGLIISTVYAHPAEISLWVLLPANQPALTGHLATYATYQAFHNGWADARNIIRANLHGC
jgi:hypothetical protein